MLMLDLFAGTGGASAAMVARGWRVVRVELDARFPADWRDVLTFTWAGERPALVWASPPCTEFARESMPWCRTGVPPDMRLVRESLRVVRDCGARFWVVENVRGAIPWFRAEPDLGHPVVKCGPVFLWGRHPPMLWPSVRGWKSKLSGSDKAARAAIPYEISHALAVGVERAMHAGG